MADPQFSKLNDSGEISSFIEQRARTKKRAREKKEIISNLIHLANIRSMDLLDDQQDFRMISSRLTLSFPSSSVLA